MIGETFCEGFKWPGKPLEKSKLKDLKTCHFLEILETFDYRTCTGKLVLIILAFSESYRKKIVGETFKC